MRSVAGFYSAVPIELGMSFKSNAMILSKEAIAGALASAHR
jgi:hypothetical protein